MDRIIILQGISNSGKTTSLNNLAKLLIEKYDKYKLLEGSLDKDGDFVITIFTECKTIGIVSMGDNLELKDKLNLLYKNKGINLYYCASRTKGITKKIVEEFSEEKNIGIIWTSTYKDETKNKNLIKVLNEIKAKELYDLSYKM